MQPYKMFISYSSQNRSTAKVIADVLQEAFGGSIDPYVAVLKIGAGAVWQKELKTNLKNRNALISIVTPRFVNKDWFFIEWAPFWLSGKPYFLLLTDGVDKSDLVPAMTDRQHTALHDYNSIVLLFAELHAAIFGAGDAVKDYGPYVNKLLAGVSVTLEQEELDYFETFRDPGNKLPADLGKAEAILKYFFNKYIKKQNADKDEQDADKDAVIMNIDKLDEEDRFKVAKTVLQKKTLGLVLFLCQAIPSPDHLHKIADRIIEMGLFDAVELIDITDMLKKTQSRVANYKIALRLIEHNQMEGELLYRNAVIVVGVDNLSQMKQVYLELINKIKHNVHLQVEGSRSVNILVLILHRMIERDERKHVKDFVKKIKAETPLLSPVLRKSVVKAPPVDNIDWVLDLFDDPNL
jgi:hypothetical protein